MEFPATCRDTWHQRAYRGVSRVWKQAPS